MCTRRQVHDFLFYILEYVYLNEFVINDIKRFDLIRKENVVVREVADRDGIGARSMQAAGNFPRLNYAF